MSADKPTPPDRDNGLPRHVAIIMDGNGRWAKQRLLPRVAGHRAGVEAVRQVVRACAEKGIEALTLFAFLHRLFASIRILAAVLFRLRAFVGSLTPLVLAGVVVAGLAFVRLFPLLGRRIIGLAACRLASRLSRH